jgi:hypothetical protein
MRGGTRVYVKRDTDAFYQNLGNIVSCTLTRNEDLQEHLSGYTGTKTVDRKRQEIKSIDYTIQTDENTIESVRAWLLGDSTTAPTQSAEVGDASTVQELIGFGGGAGEAYTDIVIGRWYSMCINKAAPTVHNPLWDTGYPIKFAAALVEGTNFKVDYIAGKITFLTAPATNQGITITGAGEAGKLTAITSGMATKFNQFSVLQIDCSAEGVYVFEDADIRDFWTIPKAQLLPSGDAAISIENDRVIEFKLSQLKHTTLDWGTYERHDVG